MSYVSNDGYPVHRNFSIRSRVIVFCSFMAAVPIEARLNLKLSDRLETLISMVPSSDLVLDVGCDHGYAAMEVIQRKISQYALASDLRPGPLSAAQQHISEAGLTDRIKTECCSGIPKDFEKQFRELISFHQQKTKVTCLIAGMGGILMRDILMDGKEQLDCINTFLFSPQSDLKLFRKSCQSLGLAITDEEMVEEDGKFYVIIRADHSTEQPMTEKELLFGPVLLKKRHPILNKYLIRRKTIVNGIMKSLSGHAKSPENQERARELQEEAKLIDEVLEQYKK